MDAWSVGLTVLVVLGLVAVVGGALYDRVRHRRRTAEILAPPQRAIPRFAPDAPAPQYLTELQARRPPADRSDAALDPSAREHVRTQLAAAGTVRVGCGWAHRAYVTDEASGWAVLDEPSVLVCADPVVSLRELLPTLERAALGGSGLVVVAPEVVRDVASTLEVNQIQRRLRVLLVLADDDARARLSAATGAIPTQASDRQAGYVPPSVLGRCARWVSDAKASHVLPSAAEDGGGGSAVQS